MATAEIWCHGSKCLAVVFCLSSNHRVDWTKLHVAQAVISFCGVGLTWYRWRMFVSCFVLNLYVFIAEILNCSGLSFFFFYSISLSLFFHVSCTKLETKCEIKCFLVPTLKKKHRAHPHTSCSHQELSIEKVSKTTSPLFFLFFSKMAIIQHRLDLLIDCAKMSSAAWLRSV